jgi:hypothetical protein
VAVFKQLIIRPVSKPASRSFSLASWYRWSHMLYSLCWLCTPIVKYWGTPRQQDRSHGGKLSGCSTSLRSASWWVIVQNSVGIRSRAVLDPMHLPYCWVCARLWCVHLLHLNKIIILTMTPGGYLIQHESRYSLFDCPVSKFADPVPQSTFISSTHYRFYSRSLSIFHSGLPNTSYPTRTNIKWNKA